MCFEEENYLFHSHSSLVQTTRDSDMRGRKSCSSCSSGQLSELFIHWNDSLTVRMSSVFYVCVRTHSLLTSCAILLALKCDVDPRYSAFAARWIIIAGATPWRPCHHHHHQSDSNSYLIKTQYKYIQRVNWKLCPSHLLHNRTDNGANGLKWG